MMKLKENKDPEIDPKDLPKPTTKTNFEGFDITKVSDNDDSYKQYKEILRNLDLVKEKGFNEAYITEMTPQEYINLLNLYIAKDPEIDPKDIN